MSTAATEVTKKLNGHGDGRGHRTAASIAKQVRTARRNRRAALAAGQPYGHTPGKAAKRAAPKRSRKPLRGRSPGAAIDALTYLGHARARLLRAATQGDTGAASTLGLVSLAIEALGGD